MAGLLEQAQLEARARDDNHVGTEHLVLGLYALGETTARRLLESLGISKQVFADQLEREAGPSPSGEIPLTPRARMIIGLAGGEAARTASAEVQPEHVLLAVIRESEMWQATGQAGPHHLLAAARAVGVTLAEVERKLIREMR
jgi:ATP-dependent Clp protease ATP-binding subunit ClpC